MELTRRKCLSNAFFSPMPNYSGWFTSIFFYIFPTLSTYYDPSILILSLLHVNPPPPLLCSSSTYDNIRGKNNIIVYSNPIERFWMCVSFITLLTQLECFWKKIILIELERKIVNETNPLAFLLFSNLHVWFF